MRIVFDLDGTLIDSLPDIAASVNLALARHGFPPLPPLQIETLIGDGAKMLLIRAFAASGGEMTETDLNVFIEHYTAHATDATAPYPGMVETLQTLHQAGHQLGVCTNKPAIAAREILVQLDLAKFFANVTGGDTTPYKKPDPRHLAATLAALGDGPAVMIGDHYNDIAAAAGCAIPAIFAAWGYGHADSPHIAQTAADLPGIIRDLLPEQG